MAEARQGYSRLQIVLHWLIAVLVVVQLASSDGVEAVFHAEHGHDAAQATESDAASANVHIVCGIAIFLLAALRLLLRVKRGAPALPEEEHPLLRFAAHATHIAFYALLLLVPLAGATAWFGGIEAAGEVHGIGVWVIIGLVLVHTVGALYHHFFLKTDVLRRILRPERSGG